jgi:CRISPR-associated endonuclease/helicase Cas3
MPTFDEFFEALWGFAPFPWQRMLAERISTGCWPEALDLPTAAGKTACIDAGVYALAAQAELPLDKRTAPRRIWFVVDRRIVVDEAYDRALTIADKLAAASFGHLKIVADHLRNLAGTGRPLATGRLRGGVLRDDSFARLPSQPAVITSTVDQLGSRLLFRSYGGSQRVASIHAGLVGNDSLILLDEAHCSVPFMQTLRQVAKYRSDAWADEPIPSPFFCAVLSATPPPEIPLDSRFPGADREAALAHPVLQQRLTARKPAELVLLQSARKTNADPLFEAAVAQASEWIRKGGKRRVALIVNRVHTADELAKKLRAEMKPDEADVVLLTGRLRPLERDALTKRWKPFLKASQPSDPERPIIFVSTQAIEVGADFSFDALVTECASLDALRQRFGRLNRMGLPGDAPAAILVREDDLKETEGDPIYGDGLRHTWALLFEMAKPEGEAKNARRIVDFGFSSLDALLSELDDEKLGLCLAPRPDAPVLLPAHLDLLCQTEPTPHPNPDVSLFLHGKDRGVPEVRVLWRADLVLKHPESWVETIAICPPISTESVSVPLYRLRRWLAEQFDADTAGDVEGGQKSEADDKDSGQRIRACLPWRGRDRSRIVRSSNGIFPGDVVVLPAAYGLTGLAQTLPMTWKKIGLGPDKDDLWEWAWDTAGKPPALRIQRNLWEAWMNQPAVQELVTYTEDYEDDRTHLWELIENVLANQTTNESSELNLPDWLSKCLSSIPRNRSTRIDIHPAKGLILSGRKRSRIAAEPDLFADDDDLTSISGEELSLETHTKAVVNAVRKMAGRCLPKELLPLLDLAAEWHDTGKLDERFQLLLHHGDELAAITGDPLAKSPDIPLSQERRNAIRAACALPTDFRHEMLSTQLAHRFALLPDASAQTTLVLHLIASHHGRGRPFAPICIDKSPVAIEGKINGTSINLPAEERAALTPPHRINSGLAERFWELTRRYGWWGLAYLEANLRLADWYGSEFGPTSNASSEELP